MCEYVCVCIYVYVCICVCVCMYICRCVYVCLHACMSVCVCVYVSMYACIVPAMVFVKWYKRSQFFFLWSEICEVVQTGSMCEVDFKRL